MIMHIAGQRSLQATSSGLHLEPHRFETDLGEGRGPQVTRPWTLLLGLLVLAISACTNGGGGGKAGPGETPAGAPPGGAAIGPPDLTTALLAIEQGPRYPQSDWGYLVLDQKTGEVLASQSPVRMFDAGSTMKTFAVSAALEHYGNDYVFRTPVYRAGTQSGDSERKPRPRRLR